MENVKATQRLRAMIDMEGARIRDIPGSVVISESESFLLMNAAQVGLCFLCSFLHVGENKQIAAQSLGEVVGNLAEAYEKRIPDSVDGLSLFMLHLGAVLGGRLEELLVSDMKIVAVDQEGESSA